MDANKTNSKTANFCHWAILVFVIATLGIASGQTQPVSSSLTPGLIAQPATTVAQQAAPSPLPSKENQAPESRVIPLSSASPTPIPSPTPVPVVVPAHAGPGFVFPELNNHELVVTAVGDVMLGTTFPDEASGLLP